MQFFWLPQQSPSPFPCSSSILDGQTAAKLSRVDIDSKLCSRDILTFETNDPVGHPLPSIKMLEMQWILHQVLALSGAADATNEELDPKSDRHLGLTSGYQEEVEVSGEEEEEEEEE